MACRDRKVLGSQEQDQEQEVAATNKITLRQETEFCFVSLLPSWVSV